MALTTRSTETKLMPRCTTVTLSLFVALSATATSWAQPLDCSQTPDDAWKLEQCLETLNLAYQTGWAAGFVHACGSEYEGFFDSCSATWFGSLERYHLVTDETFAALTRLTKRGYATGAAGSEVPQDVSCDTILEMITESPIGQNCIGTLRMDPYGFY